MNNCTACNDCFRNDSRNKVICDGICRQAFHAECVNFNKDALLHYREMPNLKWLCDTCIIHSSNVSYASSRRFNEFNSTVFARTSSPSYVRSSLPAVNRKNKTNRGVKPATSSGFLVKKHPKVNRYINNANDSFSPPSKHQMRSENQTVKTTDADKSSPPIASVNSRSDVACVKPNHTENFEVESENEVVQSRGVVDANPPTASVTSQSDIAQPKPLHNRVDGMETHKETSEIKKSSSFAEILTKSPISKPAPAGVTNVLVKPQSDSTQSRRILSPPPSEAPKVAYVTRVHRDTTEEEIVNSLLEKNVITSAKDVSCVKLISSHVDLNTVSFVSFMISGSSDLFHSITKDKFWPGDILAREFVKR